MSDYHEILGHQNVMIIAPAGYGKTHLIVESLKYSEGRQLILTHTHAGIASVKEKILREKIAQDKYNVETITSFTQKYVFAFYDGELPDQSNTNIYYQFVLEKAIELLKIQSIRKIIQDTYTGIFVDEYQDCSLQQHELILLISQGIPTRILGDPLQGIFDFKGQSLVNISNPQSLGELCNNIVELKEPWRWKNSGNAALGEDLKKVRRRLIESQDLNLADFGSIEVNLISDGDLFVQGKLYRQKFNRLLSEENLLVIHPISHSTSPRISVIQSFSNRLTMIESIDDKNFYEFAGRLDAVNSDNPMPEIISILQILLGKTAVKDWFSDTSLKNKKADNDKVLQQPIRIKIDELHESYSTMMVSELFKLVRALPGMKCYRIDLFNSICSALENSMLSEMSVLEAMKARRNSIRRLGRKVYGRSIGTTLLTKGLEFDTVVILDAHKFNSLQHLYVALTRASKRLVIFTTSNNISIKP